MPPGLVKGRTPHARMNGRLTDQPLVELIQEISGASGSGALRLAREQARAVIYFDGGHVVAALSNLRPLRLVEFVRRSGAVEEARLAALVREGMSDEQAGLLLMRTGLIDHASLARLNERRSHAVLREVLRWAEGEWSFDPRVRLAGERHGAGVEASALLVETARSLPPGFAASRVADEEMLKPVSGAGENTGGGGVQLLPAEAFVLSRVYEPMRLSDLLMLGGLPEEETRRAVYILALGRLLERPERRRVLSPEVLKQAAKRPATEATATPAQTEPGQPSTPEGERTAPEPEADTRGTVEELLERARGETHYEVLGVRRSATADEIKRTYYAHARRLHPDHFRRDADAETQQRIDAAFARIARAYDTLKDASLRAAYDLKLSKKSKQ
jgi:DnaJ-domain-containing protein 1